MNGFVTSRVTAAAAAVILGVIGLSSARAADYSPPPAYPPPPEYAPPTESAPPQTYVAPPAYVAPRAYLAPRAYEVPPVEVVPVYPPTVYVAPPLAYPYFYRRYSYAPIYHDRFFAPHGRGWFNNH
jgi:hypothetical protein